MHRIMKALLHTVSRPQEWLQWPNWHWQHADKGTQCCCGLPWVFNVEIFTMQPNCIYPSICLLLLASLSVLPLLPKLTAVCARGPRSSNHEFSLAFGYGLWHKIFTYRPVSVQTYTGLHRPVHDVLLVVPGRRTFENCNSTHGTMAVLVPTYWQLYPQVFGLCKISSPY